MVGFEFAGGFDSGFWWTGGFVGGLIVDFGS